MKAVSQDAETVCSRLTNKAALRQPIRVASVAMNGATDNRTIRVPLSRPIAPPAAQRGLELQTYAQTNAGGGRPHDAARDVPMGRIAMPEDISAAALWLLGDVAGFVTGINMPVGGGGATRLGA